MFHLHRSLNAACLCIAVSACASHGGKPMHAEAARQLYVEAHAAMEAGDYRAAVRSFTRLLDAGAPTVPLAAQAEAELVYSHYKARDYAAAVAAADRYIRAHSGNARADYVHYLRAVARLQLALAVPAADGRARVLALEESYELLRAYSEDFPHSEHNEPALRSLVFVRQQLAAAHLERARREFGGDDETALALARHVSDAYRGTPAADAALALIADPVAARNAAHAEAPAPPAIVVPAAPAEAAEAAASAAATAATEVTEVSETAASAASAEATAATEAAASAEAAEAAASAASAASTPSVAADTADARPTVAAAAPAPAAPAGIAIHDPRWIMQQNPERYTVELLAGSEDKVRRFVNEHNIRGSAHYPNDADRARATLIHGLYPDAASARIAAEQLSKRWGLRRAQVRRLGEVQAKLGAEAPAPR